jgi:hypothetical protein
MGKYLVDWGSISVSPRSSPEKPDKTPGRPERRKWKRFKVKFNSTVTLHGLSDIVNVADLSIGGLRLNGDPPLTFWDNVRLEFRLPTRTGQVDIRVTGRVKRVIKEDEPAGFGIEYETVPPEARRALAEYLEMLDKEPAGTGGMEIVRNDYQE